MSTDRVFQWQRLASNRWADAWEERLRALVGAQRVVLISRPGQRFVQLHAYGLSRREAESLTKNFGGKFRSQVKVDWTKQEPQRAPLKISNRLRVVWTEKAWRENQGEAIPTLLIPASVAFGTGEHATTAMCLRILASKIRQTPRLLDVGCGSGILGLAGKIFGASESQAVDFDPLAVKAARENARRNGIRMRVTQSDVLKHELPTGPFDWICANLFLEVLLATLPKFRSALAPEGHLLCSGVFRIQEEELIQAASECRLELHEKKERGRWAALLFRKIS
ncbi:MAG: 50S ribosomal protein L11 methyltransferase [Verrucomicrobiales bacterium]